MDVNEVSVEELQQRMNAMPLDEMLSTLAEIAKARTELIVGIDEAIQTAAGYLRLWRSLEDALIIAVALKRKELSARN